MLPSIEQRLAAEIAAKPAQIAAAIALLDEGATVPFISRYRKEATGGLDDTQLRMLEDRLRYLRELEDRRAAIIQSITEQNKMTPDLLKAISLAPDKTQLEDLYLPYKPKRRTKAQIAHEAGLEPLADALLANPLLNPEEEAARYLREPFTTEQGDNNPGVADSSGLLLAEPKEATKKRLRRSPDYADSFLLCLASDGFAARYGSAGGTRWNKPLRRGLPMP